MTTPKVQSDAVEYTTYEELSLPNTKTVQNDFAYGKSIEKLDPNIHIKGGGGGGGGHVIQDEGTPLEQRTNLNIIGDNVTATDDEANDATNITITTPTVDPYGRDSNGYFKLPVGTNMYG